MELKLVTLLPVMVLAGSIGRNNQPGIDELYRQMPKAELKEYLVILEKQIQELPPPGLNLLDCSKMRNMGEVDLTQKEQFRICVYYTNLKGFAEGIPEKGFTWPVEGEDKHNLVSDLAFGQIAMMSAGFLKNFQPEGLS
ncbi:unnamed protein product [Allacma fusca]|uniref:Uncharacterized protein n=1 Tax=Allacma fusca TaxID=39272 RepID=A0A8J2KNU9_9HEXA|nr:unnamed protein product [Allacma fusca]